MSLLLGTLRRLQSGSACKGASHLCLSASRKRFCSTDVDATQPTASPSKKDVLPRKPPPPPLSTDEYNQKKAEFGKKMKELRRGLYKDLEKRRINEAEAERQRLSSIQAGREIKAAKKKAEKTRGTEEHIKELEELQERCAISRAASAKRQAIRESLLEQARKERKDHLMNESRLWITREKLDARINHAFTMPDSLSSVL